MELLVGYLEHPLTALGYTRSRQKLRQWILDDISKQELKFWVNVLPKRLGDELHERRDHIATLLRMYMEIRLIHNPSKEDTLVTESYIPQLKKVLTREWIVYEGWGSRRGHTKRLKGVEG